MLYTVLAKNIAAIMALIGQATLGIGSLLGQGLVIALNDWFRKAELTADRAGLLCVQDIEPCLRTFMKLAGGARRLYEEMDLQRVRAADPRLRRRRPLATSTGLQGAHHALPHASVPDPARQAARRLARRPAIASWPARAACSAPPRRREPPA